eukprot:TRINITY_DN24673_c0_g1_i1.p1 TRINITY_DN24673_c0_g1~~TRINITY_DN24673_c0_g1_i1.p1  ORF type:complete len:130 (+),score=34.81 TRINITY_DN24673_c0_g1_i1:44-391(+)
MCIRDRIMTLFLATANSAHILTATTYLAAASGPSALFAGGSSKPDCSAGFLSAVLPFPGGSPLTPIPLSQARCGLAGATTGSLAVFAGGNSAQGYSDVVDVYLSLIHISEPTRPY